MSNTSSRKPLKGRLSEAPLQHIHGPETRATITAGTAVLLDPHHLGNFLRNAFRKSAEVRECGREFPCIRFEVVCGSTVLTHVETDELLRSRNTKTNSCLDEEPAESGSNNGETSNGCDTDRLRREERHPSAVEETIHRGE